MTERSPSPRPTPGAPLRAAVVGAGAISLEHLAFLRDSPRAELVGVVDLSPVSAEIATRRFGSGRAYTSIDEMLAGEQPDVVHVLTPPHVHAPMVRAALGAGAHVVCEKPMAGDLAETEQLLAEARAAGRRLIENHNYRFNDEVITLRDLIDAGELGQVREVDVRLALPIRDPAGRFADENAPHPIHGMPAGVLHDFLTHMSYLLLHLAGIDRFEQVRAVVSNHGGGDLFRYDDLDAVLVSAPIGDGVPVHGRLRFSPYTHPDRFSLMVRGSEGSAETDLFHPFLEVIKDRPGGSQLTPIVNHLVNGVSLATSGMRNFGSKLLQHTPYHGLARGLDRTYQALADGAEPPVTEADIVAAARVIDDILADAERSAR